MTVVRDRIIRTALRTNQIRYRGRLEQNKNIHQEPIFLYTLILRHFPLIVHGALQYLLYNTYFTILYNTYQYLSTYQFTSTYPLDSDLYVG